MKLCFKLQSMLIHCPRCGFSQPQDRYCAQCGVDMQAYRPKAIPIWRKILSHPTFQIAIVIGIAAYISLHFIQKSIYDPGNPKRPYSFLRILSPEISSTARNEVLKSNETAISTEQENTSAEDLTEDNSTTNTVMALDGQSQVMDNNTDKSENQATNNQNGIINNEQSNSQIRVSFYEIDRQILTQFFNESQNTGMLTTTNDLSIGLISNIDKKLTPSNPRIKLIHQDNPTIDLNKELSLSYGNSENELLIRIDSIDTSDANLKGHVEINRSWKDGPEGEQFEISNNSGFYISGIIPRKSGLEQDPQLKQGPFQILSSKRFQNRDSEIVMFIEFMNDK